MDLWLHWTEYIKINFILIHAYVLICSSLLVYNPNYYESGHVIGHLVALNMYYYVYTHNTQINIYFTKIKIIEYYLTILHHISIIFVWIYWEYIIIISTINNVPLIILSVLFHLPNNYIFFLMIYLFFTEKNYFFIID